jgi:hypothetical protein
MECCDAGCHGQTYLGVRIILPGSGIEVHPMAGGRPSWGFADQQGVEVCARDALKPIITNCLDKEDPRWKVPSTTQSFKENWPVWPLSSEILVRHEDKLGSIPNAREFLTISVEEGNRLLHRLCAVSLVSI